MRLDVSEFLEFDINHADVSAALLQKWGLPQSLVRLVVNHHKPDADARLSDAERRFLHLSRVGEAVANLSDCKSPQRLQVLNKLLIEYEMGSPENWKSSLADAVMQTATSAALFAIPVPNTAALTALIGQLSADCPETATCPSPGDPDAVATGPPAEVMPEIPANPDPNPEYLYTHE